MAKKDDVVSLKLDRDVALVVFDFLARAAESLHGPLATAVVLKAPICVVVNAPSWVVLSTLSSVPKGKVPPALASESAPLLLILDVKRLGIQFQHLLRCHQRVAFLGVIVVEELEAGILHRVGNDVIPVRIPL